MSDLEDRIHCLTVERRKLREQVWTLRAIIVTLAVPLLVLVYGYATHWAGVW